MVSPRALVQGEMQKTLSKVWSQIVNSISYNNNHYTMYLKIENLFNIFYSN